MQHRNVQRGFSLLEVLVSLVIFSIGLLGVAGLMVLSVRSNHTAYLHTQAAFLAGSMADRMRANIGQIGEYSGTYGASTAGAAGCTECSPAELAQRDIAVWSQQLVDQLPSGQADIDCDDAPPEAGYQGIQPYAGLCRMDISWSEDDLSGSSAPRTETFSWVFQP